MLKCVTYHNYSASPEKIKIAEATVEIPIIGVFNEAISGWFRAF